MRKLRSFMLRKGMLLYHGTSAEESFDVPNAPAWFSTSESVAEYFMEWHKGPCPRILVYRLERNYPRLAAIESRQDFEVLLGDDAPNDPVEMAERVCSQTPYDGWYIPYNYSGGGDDIMLCDTSMLTLVECRNVV